MTIDAEVARELLRTLRNTETVLKALDAVEAAAENAPIRSSPLTLDTVRAREWLADAIADDEARRLRDGE